MDQVKLCTTFPNSLSGIVALAFLNAKATNRARASWMPLDARSKALGLQFK